MTNNTTAEVSEAMILKPCPFCGAKLSGLEHGAFGHEIDSPDCILSYTAFDASDIERWNTRAMQSEVSEAVIEAVAEMRSEAEGAVMCPKKRKWLRLTVDLAERAMQSERLKGDGEDRIEAAYREGYEDGWCTGTAAMEEDRAWNADADWQRSNARTVLSPPSDGVSRDE